MHRVYTNEFLIHSDSKPWSELATDVVEWIRLWIRDSLRAKLGDPSLEIEIGKTFESPLGLRVEWFPQTAKAASIVVVEYTHPHQDEEGPLDPARLDPNRFWKITIRIVQFNGLIEFKIDCASGYRQRVIKPGALRPGRPRIVLNLVQNFDCVGGAVRLSGTPRLLAKEGVAEFVKNTLEASERRLPVVLVSLDNQSQQYLVHPDELARQLVGLAEVVIFRDIAASFEFSDAVGRTLSCFNGGVRTYWPGFRRDDNPERHPLLLGRTLLEGREVGIEPLHVIRNNIFLIACSTAQDSDFYLSALKTYQEETRAAKEETRAAKKKLTGLSRVQQELEEAKQDLDEARSERDGWKAKAQNLEEENQRILQAWRESGATPDPVLQPVVEFDPAKALKDWKTAGDVVRGVEGVYERLNIWPSAVESSQGYRSPHLATLLECLRFLNDLGEDYFSPQGLRMPIVNYHTKKSVEYGEKLPEIKLTESKTNKTGKWREARTFQYEGSKQYFEKHFTIGLGGDGCIHLFFELNDAEKVVDLAYCGPHLDHSAAN